QAPARIRRRHEQAARNDLRDSPLRPRRQRPARLRPRNSRRRCARARRHLLRQRNPSRRMERPAFLAEVNSQFGVDAKAAGAHASSLNLDQVRAATRSAIRAKYEDKEKQLSAELMRWLERRIILDVVHSQWKDHLLSLDHLKEAIGLRGYAQKDPLVE